MYTVSISDIIINTWAPERVLARTIGLRKAQERWRLG